MRNKKQRTGLTLYGLSHLTTLQLTRVNEQWYDNHIPIIIFQFDIQLLLVTLAQIHNNSHLKMLYIVG